MTNITRRGLIRGTAAGTAIAIMGDLPHATARQDNKPSVSVGSKNFTESLIVGEMLSMLLEHHGFEVDRKLNLGGTLIAHESLDNGDIDTYIEYTGTGLMAILGHELPNVSDEVPGNNGSSASPEASSLPQEVYDIVAREYPEHFGIEWLEPWGFNNTNALIMTRALAESLEVSTISDLQPFAADLVLGSDQEFRVRPDGLPEFEKTYDFSFADVMSGDIGLMYQAVADGDVDIIQGYSTDGRIESLDLVLLEDDRTFFPPYFAAPVVRQQLLEEAPEIEDIFNQLSGAIDDRTMTAINARVDVDGLEPSEAAEEYLEQEGLIGS